MANLIATVLIQLEMFSLSTWLQVCVAFGYLTGAAVK